MLEVTAPPGYSFLPDAGSEAESQLVAAGEKGVSCPESLIRDSSLPMLKSHVESPCTVTLTTIAEESMMEQPSASLQVAKTNGDVDGAAAGGGKSKEAGSTSESDTAKPSAKPPQKAQTIRLDLSDKVTPSRPPRSVCWLARGSESDWYEKNKNSKLCLIRHPRTYHLTVAVAAPPGLCEGNLERSEIGFDLSELRCKEDPGFWSYTVKGAAAATTVRARAHRRVMKARSVVDTFDTDSFVTGASTSCGISRPCPADKPYCRAEIDGACTSEPEWHGIPLQRMDRPAGVDAGGSLQETAK
ncbi:unnamed protein product [Amoebophrya sp. A120]|nr:unnamed protein product [Amoebophrya sp. A120]|eukprot:GSA120T00004890001.1